VSGAVEVGILVGGAAVGVAVITVAAALAVAAAWRETGHAEKARVAQQREAAWRAASWEAAVQEALDRNARIAVCAASVANARERFGDLAVVVPQPLCVDGQSTQELLGWCDQVDAELAAVRAELARRAATAMTAQLLAAAPAQDGGGPAGPVNAAQALAAAGERPGAVSEAMRLVGRIDPDVAPADWDAVMEAVDRVADASPGEVFDQLGEVRVRVNAANKRARQRVDDAFTAAHMLQGLAGYEGEGAEETRAALADVVAGRRAMSPELGDAAAARLAAHKAELEHQYVVEKVAVTLEELGYEAAPGFETLTAAGGVCRLTRSGWADHAVAVAVDRDSQEVRTAVIRTSKGDGEEHRRIDAEREQQWCDSFTAARARLEAAGIHAVTKLEVPPGQRSLPVASASAPTPMPATSTRHQKRERSR
jgi:hypothetical protein